MARWPMVALGEVLSRHEDWITPEPDSEYRQVTMRLWGRGAKLRAVVKGAEIAGRQNRVRAGLFLMSRIDARHGAFGLVPPELDGAIVTTDFPAYDVQAGRLDPAFLAWASRTGWFVDLCRAASEGSTNRVRLKDERFLAQRLPLPPLPEQHRIVARLDAAAKRVTARALGVEAIQAEITAALRAAFTGVTTGAPRRSMGEVAPLVRRPARVDANASYPELGVRSFGRGTFHKPNLSGIEVGSKKLFRIESGDLLFNIVFAWEGAIAVASDADHGRFGSHRFLTRVPELNQVTAPFLCYYFLTPEGLQRLGEASPGGAGRNRTLGLKALDGIKVPIPSVDAQLWFDALQKKAEAVHIAQAAASATLDTLLPALLHEAFE